MDKETRNAIQRSTQRARELLEREIAEQLEGTYDIRLDGTIAPAPGSHLDDSEQLTRAKLVAAVEHFASFGRTRSEAVADYLRETAFTTLNRFVALKLLEARKLVQECVSSGDQSAGFKEFGGLAPGLSQLPDQGYRLYFESIFDEIGQEVGILFDRRDPSSLIWPRRPALTALLEILNDPAIAGVWDDDETIGWVYQYFNSADERKQMRDESAAPRNSRELAVRNQFFTPRYVVQFLVDNTLARTWWQMRGGDTKLADQCEYLVLDNADELERAKKDPRDLKILDPACGSGHFLLYAFDLLLTIYEEAWADEESPRSEATGRTLRGDFASLESLHRELPALILGRNLYGVDIDARASQIAALALWLRAQRAYRDFEVPLENREPIRRSHIVTAEPMPGDPTLVEEFAESLQPPLLRPLFRRMVSEMDLAGELGTLLRVDEAIALSVTNAREEYVRQATDTGHLPGLEPEQRQQELDFSDIDDVRFFEEAEELLLDALRRFSESASGAGGVRRWLFADDAAQGIALIELLRARYDIVLMNPPFGKPIERTYNAIAAMYSGYHADIYLAFVRRALQLTDRGLVGCITSRSFLVKRRIETPRVKLFVPYLALLWDLGLDVMDDAAVEAAAYVIDSRVRYAATFLDSRYSAVKEFATSSRVDVPDTRKFENLPFNKIIWSMPPSIERLFQVDNRYEPIAGTAREGMKTFSDERFLRLPWEVEHLATDRWIPFVKGGENNAYFGLTTMRLNRYKSGAELDCVNEVVNGSHAQVRQASKYWFLSGATYSRRAARFAARAMPAGCVFSGRGPAVLPHPEIDQYAHLAWLNSTLVRRLIELQSNKQEYMTGTIKSLPWPRWESGTSERLRALVRSLFEQWVAAEMSNELSLMFVAPAPQGSPMRWTGHPEPGTQAELDALVNEAYGVDGKEIERLVDLLGDEAGESLADHQTTEEDQAEGESAANAGGGELLLSWALGVAIGRFDVRFATGEINVPPPRDPFDDLPARAPAVLETAVVAEGRSDYPLALPASGILVDDAGHRRDLMAAARAVFDVVFGDEATDHWLDTSHEQDPRGADLRTWFARQFFSQHIRQYSRSRRKAPIYWQLATPSASYSVWLYGHRMGRDSLYQVLNDFVTPKLQAEERKLHALTQESGPNPSSSQRKELAAQEGFLSELRVLRDEVARVAPLWNPDLNDGVVIVTAPLYRLVPQLKSWQKELKTHWDALCAGKYDWAQLAMHLWPERVVPKCAEDRSLAIAHDLEDVFWEQDSGGKWQARQEPTRSIEELVAERTSPAVKDALESLLSAPPLTTPKRSRKRAA